MSKESFGIDDERSGLRGPRPHSQEIDRAIALRAVSGQAGAGASPARSRGVRSSRIAALVVVGFLLFSLSSILIGHDKDGANSRLQAYVPHPVIVIDDDIDFANQASSEGWPGSGLPTDPYVISGYEIDGTGYDFGVFIGNTTVCYELRECSIYGASFCIWLSNLTNGLVEENVFPPPGGNSIVILESVKGVTVLNNSITGNSGDCIILQSSQDCVVADNTFEGGYSMGIQVTASYGLTIANNTFILGGLDSIWLMGSANDTISGNNIPAVGDDGIDLNYVINASVLDNLVNGASNRGIISAGCDDIRMINNSVSNCYYCGIYISDSTNCNLTKNNLSENGIFMAGSYLENWNSHEIDVTNLVNGKPVQYAKDQTSGTVAQGAGQVILANCSHMTVQGQALSNCTGGIWLAFSSSNIVADNVCDNSSVYGIYLQDSGENTLVRNSCSMNSRGIFIQNSPRNQIIDCTCTGAWDGISLVDGSHGCNISGSVSVSNARFGIYVGSSWFTNVTWTNCSDNGDYGIFADSGSDFAKVSNCLFVYNTYWGVVLAGSNYCEVWNNSFRYNHGSTEVYSINHIQGYDDGLYNAWNQTGYGNYWLDWQSPDSNHDGIVDVPYSIEGSSGSKDYFPLTTEPAVIPEFSSMLVVPLFLGLVLALSVGRRVRKKKSL